MGSEPKDSAEVIQFRRLYNEVRAAAKDDPDRLELLAKDDPSLSKLCSDLSIAVWNLDRRQYPQLFVVGVDPAFLREFHEYKARWQAVVAGIFLARLQDKLIAPKPKGVERDKIQFENADYDAEQLADALYIVIQFADQVRQDALNLGEEPDELIEKVSDGVAAWFQLTRNIGLDIRGIFRRRELAPFTLVPRHVAHPKTPSRSSQFWLVYERATDAFVIGNFHAAIALMRAIVESLLQRAYGASVFDLRKKINSVGNLLPPAANQASLLRLRNLAVAVLHLESENMSDEERRDAERRLKPDRIEEETRQLLFVVRSLIENAPQQLDDN